jgi:hypothetical protein
MMAKPPPFAPKGKGMPKPGKMPFAPKGKGKQPC